MFFYESKQDHPCGFLTIAYNCHSCWRVSYKSLKAKDKLMHHLKVSKAVLEGISWWQVEVDSHYRRVTIRGMNRYWIRLEDPMDRWALRTALITCLRHISKTKAALLLTLKYRESDNEICHLSLKKGCFLVTRRIWCEIASLSILRALSSIKWLPFCFNSSTRVQKVHQANVLGTIVTPYPRMCLTWLRKRYDKL